MTLTSYCRKDKPHLCISVSCFFTLCDCKFLFLCVPSDFSLIREGGETMWKSHEWQGWGINKRRESSCTVCVCVCSGFTSWKGPTGGHQGSCLLIILSHAMNSTTPPPAITDADAAISYVLVPFFLITVIGIVVAVVSWFDTQGNISWDRPDYS